MTNEVGCRAAFHTWVGPETRDGLLTADSWTEVVFRNVDSLSDWNQRRHNCCVLIRFKEQVASQADDLSEFQFYSKDISF